ncbi:MAG TPA: hypothetical protein VGF94_18880 [Kofleriaceae bacterium]|jgi:uncharacterized protein involved in exopolysaccharide biosynthesis
MANSQLTARDRLQRLVDLGGKTLRYWWLVALFAVVGGALSLTFALVRTRNYQSWATLFYQERIQSSLLSNREEVAQRNIADRYRELLYARAQLEPIVDDPALNAFSDTDTELAIDKLRNQIHFEARGANAFRIVYADSDPDRAQAVTAKLTNLLQSRDETLRNDQAAATVSFVTTQKEEASTELRKREQALAEFLAKHPEFVQDPNQQGEGAAVRAIRNQSKTPTGNPRLYALERQRERIQARLDAGPDSPPIHIAVAASPEKIAAEAVVADAQRELSSASRELEEAMGKYTEKHPAVVNARDRVEEAQQRLRHAQAAVPPDIETPIVPATPADRTKLQKQLAELESQISDEQKRSGKSGQTSSDATTNWVVQLETKYADVRRAVNEERERVQSLADSVFRAQMDASTKAAETGGRLSVVDPAFKPVQPTGPGKTIFLLAGMIVFLSLGGAIAVGLAVIDDRLYRRADIDPFSLAVLAVIPPPARRRKGRA